MAGLPSPSPDLARATPGRGRFWQIDAVRGLMLVLMTLTHVPTRFASSAGQPFGYVSAAEGFVLLSAFMAGWIYTVRQQRSGVPEMRVAFLRRVLKIYLSQAALLVFLFSAVSAIGLMLRQAAITDLVSFYLGHPAEAIVGALLLVYNPPLLDILPMYILFMLASPLVLVHGLRHGWRGLLATSAVLWLGAQFGLGRALYGAFVAVTGLDIPLAQTGAFGILAWQLLWMLGLWLGWIYATRGGPGRPPRPLVIAAIAVGGIGFVWRHAIGQAAFPGHEQLNLLFDKWQLGPLRLLDLGALVVLAMHYEPWLTKHLPRARALELLGTASLPVFCAHLVMALLALAVFGASRGDRPVGIDLALLASSFTVLYAVAFLSRGIHRHAARARAGFATARMEPLSADGRRWPISRWRSPRR